MMTPQAQGLGDQPEGPQPFPVHTCMPYLGQVASHPRQCHLQKGLLYEPVNSTNPDKTLYTATDGASQQVVELEGPLLKEQLCICGTRNSVSHMALSPKPAHALLGHWQWPTGRSIQIMVYSPLA